MKAQTSSGAPTSWGRQGQILQDLLLDLGGGLDVADHRPARHVGRDGEILHGPGELEDVIAGAVPGSGEADIGRVDPQLVHHVDQLDLVGQARVEGAGALQAVPQGLVHQLNFPEPGGVLVIPVVDQCVIGLAVGFHHQLLGRSGIGELVAPCAVTYLSPSVRFRLASPETSQELISSSARPALPGARSEHS